ncbi:MAG: hypothetical protein K1000chlam4_00203 [Chlamydiae bacterium]|nr:hypothetical protein [Chlamydiota bacterium]
MKPVLWIASSKKDLTTMPEKVMTDLGYALYEAQRGEFSGNAIRGKKI